MKINAELRRSMFFNGVWPARKDCALPNLFFMNHVDPSEEYREEILRDVLKEREEILSEADPTNPNYVGLTNPGHPLCSKGYGWFDPENRNYFVWEPVAMLVVRGWTSERKRLKPESPLSPPWDTSTMRFKGPRDITLLDCPKSKDFKGEWVVTADRNYLLRDGDVALTFVN